MSMPSVSTRVLAGVLLASAAVAAGLLVSPASTVATVESLAADPSLFAGAVVGLYLVRPLFAWPTTPLAAAVGYGYGVATGVPVALAGILVTVTPVFLAVRLAAGAGDDADGNATAQSTGVGTVDSLLERTNAAVTGYYETAGPLRGVTASRLAPIPSDVSTCAAAVSGVGFRHFALGTVIGELPWTVAAVVVGASAATVTTGGLGELGVALTVACCLAALLLLAGPIYRVLDSRWAPKPADALKLK